MITSFFAPKSQSYSSTKSSSSKRERETGDSAIDTAEPKRTKNAADSSSQVEELLSYMNDDENATAPWKKALSKHASSPSFARLAKFVAQERKKRTVYPPPQETWSALNLTPLSQVKVVIVGQDPYHGPGQAHGLCFSVRKGQAIPPSLRNIYKELSEDPAIRFTTPQHGYLAHWAKRGVLMINTVLTVRRGEANSHKSKGWEVVTDEVIRAVDRHTRSTGKGVVFLLWGKPAAKKTQALVSSSSRHTIICTSHPSPLGATKTASPFTGSRCFSRCNEALEKMGHEPIDWNLD